MKKFVITTFIVCAMLISCSSKPSLESYFIDNQENKDFIFVDVAPQMLGLDKSKLTVAQANALHQFRKVNVLAFKKTAGQDSLYAKEKEKVTEILKDKKYEQLMRFGSGKAGAVVKALGTGDTVDEFILFGYEGDNGFALVRILGDDMTADSFVTLMDLLRQSDIDLEQLSFFKELRTK